MLKLTYSFCRYSRLTYDNVSYNTVVNNLTHLNCRRKTCVTLNSHEPLLSPVVPISLPLRLLAHIKKRFRVKKSHVNSNSTKTHKQMSEHIQPTSNFGYGGQFDISTGDATSTESSSDDNNTVYNSPSGFRTWEPVARQNTCYDGFKFKVMSYNVLAQYLLECHPYLYTGCGSRNLKWKVRAAKIYDEILSLSPDILCLQEVQVSHLNKFYKKFEEMGYLGVFKQKTGERQDGCAIYFKKSLFDMQDNITVEFYQPELPILNRDNIGLMVKLTPKCSPTTPIVVATTHLLYNPKRTDVRLAQMQLLLAEIDRFAFTYDGKESGYMPIILTGDFNSTPDSAVLNLLDKGHVRATQFRDSSDWQKIGVMDNCQHLSVYLNRHKGIPTDFSMTKIHNSDYSTIPRTPDLVSDTIDYSDRFNSDELQHALRLTSVYHKVKANGQNEATTYQDYWVTVDYIYFGCHNALRLVDRLRLPTTSECEFLGKLPNDRFGSDHLALAATFELKLVKSTL